MTDTEKRKAGRLMNVIDQLAYREKRFIRNLYNHPAWTLSQKQVKYLDDLFNAHCDWSGPDPVSTEKPARRFFIQWIPKRPVKDWF